MAQKRSAVLEKENEKKNYRKDVFDMLFLALKQNKDLGISYRRVGCNVSAAAGRLINIYSDDRLTAPEYKDRYVDAIADIMIYALAVPLLNAMTADDIKRMQDDYRKKQTGMFVRRPHRKSKTGSFPLACFIVEVSTALLKSLRDTPRSVLEEDLPGLMLGVDLHVQAYGYITSLYGFCEQAMREIGMDLEDVILKRCWKMFLRGEGQSVPGDGFDSHAEIIRLRFGREFGR